MDRHFVAKMFFRTFLFVLVALLSTAEAGGPIGPHGENSPFFVEDFALAADRRAVVDRHVPGTLQHTVRALLHLGAERRGNSTEFFALHEEACTRFPSFVHHWNLLRLRAVLLGGDEAEAMRLLAEEVFGLSLWTEEDDEEQREKKKEEEKLPSRLEQPVVAEEDLVHVLKTSGVPGLTAAAWPWLLRRVLPLKSKLHLVQDLDASAMTMAGVEQLVADTLRSSAEPSDAGLLAFGSARIHMELTTQQLDNLAYWNEYLWSDRTFINVQLAKIAPPSEVDLSVDREAKRQYLLAAKAIGDKAGRNMGALRAMTSQMLLAMDMCDGVYDEALFLDFVAAWTDPLPRQDVIHTNWPSMQLAKDMNVFWHFAVHYIAEAEAAEGTLGRVMSALGGSRQRSFWMDKLEPFVDKSGSSGSFAHDLAVAMLQYGPEDETKRSVQELGSEDVDRLREASLEFSSTCNQAHFDIDDPVSLVINSRNVGHVTVDMFDIDAGSVFTATKKRVSADLDLEGLLPVWTTTVPVEGKAIRNIMTTLSIPGLEGRRGTFIFEARADGTSSRALVHKGGFSVLERDHASGRALVVIDERRRPVENAVVRLGTQAFDAVDGVAVLPFASASENAMVAIVADGHTSLANVDLVRQNVTFEATFFTEASQLLQGATANVLVTPRLKIGDVRMSMSVLDNVKLFVQSIALDGTRTISVVDNVTLSNAQPFNHPFAVPTDCASFTFRLAAELKLGEHVHSLSAERQVRVNTDHDNSSIGGLFLRRANGRFLLAAISKNGDPLAAKSVKVAFQHRMMRDRISKVFETPANGTIDLGSLTGVVAITARFTTSKNRFQWNENILLSQRHLSSNVIFATVGQQLSMPLTLGHQGLVQLRNRPRTVVRNLTPQCRKANGRFMLPESLPVGEYLLFQGESRTSIFVANGTIVERFAVTNTASFDGLTVHQPVSVASVVVDDERDEISIQLSHATPQSRVFVLATHFAPSDDLLTSLSLDNVRPRSHYRLHRSVSEFARGRALSSESRYVFDRRSAERRVGMFLDRPRLLLRPRFVAETETDVEKSEVVHKPKRLKADEETAARLKERVSRAPGPQTTLPDGGISLEFLAEQGILVPNVATNENGTVVLPSHPLLDNGRAHITVVAVDQYSSSSMSVGVRDDAKPEAIVRDSWHQTTLDVSKPVHEKRTVHTLDAGDKLDLDLQWAKFKVIDSIGGAFDLFQMLAPANVASQLEQFRFLTKWSSLSFDEKQIRYDTVGSHEVDLFLKRHDPAFFESVVRPHLANKLDKRVVDLWLLDRDVRSFAWDDASLNDFERILLDPSKTVARAGHTFSLSAKEEREFFRTVLRSGALNAVHVESDDSFEESSFEAVLEDPGLYTVLYPPEGGPGADLEGPGLRTIVLPPPEGGPGADLEDSGLYTVVSPPEGGPGGTPRPMGPRGPVGERGPSGLVGLRGPHGIQRPSSQDGPQGPRWVTGTTGDRVVSITIEAEEELAFHGAVLSNDAAPRGFQAIGSTNQFAETHFFNTDFEKSHTVVPSLNKFWVDFAASLASNETFAPLSFIQPTRSVNEVLLALSSLNLACAGTNWNSTTGTAATAVLHASAPVLVFVESLVAEEAPDLRPTIAVTQQIIDPDNQAADVKHLETFKVYETVVTLGNMDKSALDAEVQMRIPLDAIPIQSGSVARSKVVRAKGTSVVQVDRFRWLIRKPGPLRQFPAHVVVDGQTVAIAPPVDFVVVNHNNTIAPSWPDVVKRGSVADIVDFLSSTTLDNSDFKLLGPRLADKETFLRVAEAMQVRNPFVLGHGLLHGDVTTAREFLHLPSNLNRFAFLAPLETRLLSLPSPFPVLEFDPLVMPRAHALDGKRPVLNAALRRQWTKFVTNLSLKVNVTATDELIAAYHLLLMERFREAKDHVDRAVALDAVRPCETRMQLAYFRAYFALAAGDFALARSIALPFGEDPTVVRTWHKRFQVMLREIDGAQTNFVATKQQNGVEENAIESPLLDLSVSGATVTVTHVNVGNVTLRIHEMDAELLFSIEPFQKPDHISRSTFIKPAAEIPIVPESGTRTTSVALPERFRHAHLRLVASAGSLSQSAVVQLNGLLVTLTESAGVLQVTDKASGAPLAGTYVKVFARVRGDAKFLKDGYTSWSGRFDYAAVSSHALDHADRLAILVVSDDKGSFVQEVDPPKLT